MPAKGPSFTRKSIDMVGSSTWMRGRACGFSISLMKLDQELKHYLDLPAGSFGFSSL